MKRDMKDRVVRMGSMNGVFSIKSCYSWVLGIGSSLSNLVISLWS